jgi:hypothetical protein
MFSGDTMTTADAYRKRAAAADKSQKNRSRLNSEKLRQKSKALSAMADNQDWLDGKTGSQLKPDPLQTPAE